MAWFKEVVIETIDGEIEAVTRDEQFNDGQYHSDLRFCRDGLARESYRPTKELPPIIQVEDFENEADLILEKSMSGWCLSERKSWNNKFQ